MWLMVLKVPGQDMTKGGKLTKYHWGLAELQLTASFILTVVANP